MQNETKLKRSINFYRGLTAIMFLIIVFIGMGNMNYSDQLKAYQDSYPKLEAENKCLTDEIKKYKSNLLMETCLPKLVWDANTETKS